MFSQSRECYFIRDNSPARTEIDSDGEVESVGGSGEQCILLDSLPKTQAQPQTSTSSAPPGRSLAPASAAAAAAAAAAGAAAAVGAAAVAAAPAASVAPAAAAAVEWRTPTATTPAVAPAPTSSVKSRLRRFSRSGKRRSATPKLLTTVQATATTGTDSQPVCSVPTLLDTITTTTSGSAAATLATQATAPASATAAEGGPTRAHQSAPELGASGSGHSRGAAEERGAASNLDKADAPPPQPPWGPAQVVNDETEVDVPATGSTVRASVPSTGLVQGAEDEPGSVAEEEEEEERALQCDLHQPWQQRQQQQLYQNQQDRWGRRAGVAGSVNDDDQLLELLDDRSSPSQPMQRRQCRTDGESNQNDSPKNRSDSNDDKNDPNTISDSDHRLDSDDDVRELQFTPANSRKRPLRGSDRWLATPESPVLVVEVQEDSEAILIDDGVVEVAEDDDQQATSKAQQQRQELQRDHQRDQREQQHQLPSWSQQRRRLELHLTSPSSSAKIRHSETARFRNQVTAGLQRPQEANPIDADVVMLFGRPVRLGPDTEQSPTAAATTTTTTATGTETTAEATTGTTAEAKAAAAAAAAATAEANAATTATAAAAAAVGEAQVNEAAAATTEFDEAPQHAERPDVWLAQSPATRKGRKSYGSSLECGIPMAGGSPCCWRPGGVGRPLELLMFEESPLPDRTGARMLGNLLDTPPDAFGTMPEASGTGQVDRHVVRPEVSDRLLQYVQQPQQFQQLHQQAPTSASEGWRAANIGPSPRATAPPLQATSPVLPMAVDAATTSAPAPALAPGPSKAKGGPGPSGRRPLVSSYSADCAPRATYQIPKTARLAAWWTEEEREDGSPMYRRVEEGAERELNEKFRSALLATQRNSHRGAAGAAELLAAFRGALEGINVRALRCVALDGEVAKRLPLELRGDSRISAIRLPCLEASGRAALAGSALRRAKSIVEELLQLEGPAVFKIGITCNPLNRWLAYANDGYHQFHLLYATEESGVVQMLEAALIDAFQERPGCRNIARGGEGPVGKPPFFAYLALAPCRDAVGLHLQPCVQRKRMRIHN